MAASSPCLLPGKHFAARRTIDAGGRPVLPGLLDTHVHLGTAAQSFADDCASEQQLVEAIMGTLALKGSPHWPIPELEKLWTEEALTAAVLPRYHVDVNVKRALGAKLGSLRDQGAA